MAGNFSQFSAALYRSLRNVDFFIVRIGLIALSVGAFAIVKEDALKQRKAQIKLKKEVQDQVRRENLDRAA